MSVCVCAVLARPAVSGQQFGSHDVMHLYQPSGSAANSRRPSQHLEVMRRKDIFYSGSLLNIPQYKLAVRTLASLVVAANCTVDVVLPCVWPARDSHTFLMHV